MLKQKIWILRVDCWVYVCIAVIVFAFCVSESGVALEMDFGDAPAPYPTFSDANGARHIINPDVYLGSDVDPEEDGQPDNGALGDDNNGDDDEDGVTFTSSLVPGSTATVTVVASVQGTLNAWMDFNIDGDWDDGEERIFVDLTLSSGVNNLDFDLPPGASSGSTFARFRFSLQPEPDLSFVGQADSGEVEDYQVEIDVPDPAIDIQKYTNDQDADTPTGPVVEVGSPVTWTYEVTNVGNVPLSSVTVTDSQGVTVSCPPVASLDPGESMICNASGTAAAGQYENVGMATATSPQGQDVMDEDLSHYLGELPPTDFGDAPDPTYPTLLESDGARHIIVSNVYLGNVVDADADGQPDSNSYGDDNDGGDDEDGIGWSWSFAPGETNTLNVVASTDGYMNAWIDTNNDGDWVDPDEQILTDRFVASGINALDFNLPVSATIGYSYGRFRFNTAGGLSYTGLAQDGEVEDHIVVIDGLDFGDAPEPYPTLRGGNGARHISGSLFYLGSSIDSESEGQPDPAALGDDGDGNDDEDGVTFTSALVPGSAASVTVVIPTPLSTIAYLNAWMDFNIDGDWADSGERIFTDYPITYDGSHNLSFNVPSGASTGTTFARFRIGGESGISYDGLAHDGEVEDYQVEILEPMDYGDAPDTYRTLLTSNGARHAHDADVFLGLKIDLEPDGQPDANAAGDDMNGDNDEDGVSIGPPMQQGQPYQITVTASTDGLLNAWLDFNGDGVWNVPDEQIFTDQALTPGPNTLKIDIPIDAATGATFARFRFSRQGGLSFEGRAEDGEVEDYIVEILEAELDYGDAPDPTYPTLLESNGARHVLGSGVYLGNGVDADANGQPNSDATGDDFDGNDDEDGIGYSCFSAPDETNRLSALASKDGYLNAWVDFNDDGDWADADEQIFTDEPLAAGFNSLEFSIPLSAKIGYVYGRFRFSTQKGLSYDGLAEDGEVEDHRVRIKKFDYGDAPPPYPTLRANNGARHIAESNNYYLGKTVDGELNGLPHSNAMGDDNDGSDDEDGVIFTSALTPGSNATISVESFSVHPGAPLLNAWIDFNIDGDWADAGEQIFTNEVLSNSATQNLSFNVPAGAVPGTTFARFRLGDEIGLSFDGPTCMGEVEDYQVEIRELMDYGDAPDTYRTLLGSNGARHAYDSDVFLGTELDLETDGHPDAGAGGDDLDNVDDEDGVSIASPLRQGQPYQVTVTASIEGLLNAWLDFNGDGVWTIPDEQIFTDQPLAAGPNNLTFNVPVDAIIGDTFARFRFSRQAGLLFGDRAEDGEVEDYIVEILEQNNPPESTDDDYSTYRGEILIVSAPGVLENDHDADDDPLTAVPESEASHGTVDLNPDGSFTYNPDTDFVGPDQFSYRANDGIENGDAAVVGIEVKPIIYDYGDAPDPDYPTLLASNGARHVAGSVYLGKGVDTEANGQQDSVAMGDDNDGNDDEDGLSFYMNTFPAPSIPALRQGWTEPVTVEASQPGYLNGWVDFNNDGDWADSGEQVFTNVWLSKVGDNEVTFNVPSVVYIGKTFARFRFSTQQGLSYVGEASDGEVEDYWVLIVQMTSGMEVVPDSWDFGDVEIGGHSDASFTVTNTGSAVLEVSASITGPDMDYFSIYNPSESEVDVFTLNPGESHEIGVRFAPGAANEKSAILELNYSLPGGPKTEADPWLVPLSGKCIAPDISVDPPSGDYGHVEVGNELDITFTVSNPGTMPLSITGSEITGHSDFHIIAGEGPAVIDPSGSETSSVDNVNQHQIAVKFSPTSPGEKSATLQIFNDVVDKNPFDVSLNAAGVIKTIYVSDPTGNDSTGNGSKANPFKTIYKGLIEASAAGSTVIVMDGTYKGANNRNLNVASGITVRSEYGPTNCIVDGESASVPVFWLTGGVLEGFTIQNSKNRGVWCSGSPKIMNNIIRNNETQSAGAGIFCDVSSSPKIYGNTIVGNKSDLGGGGIFCNKNSSPLIDSNIIKSNITPHSHGGGGIYCCINPSPDIENNTIELNQAGYGGGIYSECGIYNNKFCTGAMIMDNSILGNKAYTGGGLYLYGYVPSGYMSILTSNVIAGNESTVGAGVGIWCEKTTAELVNNTITGNSVPSGPGSAIYCHDSSIAVINTIVWNDQYEIGLDGSSKITVSYSDVQGGKTGGIVAANGSTINWGANNINADPKFMNAALDNYYLFYCSPCINKGTSSGAPTKDIAGNSRVGLPEIGAYEYTGIAHLALDPPVSVWDFGNAPVSNYLEKAIKLSNSSSESVYIAEVNITDASIAEGSSVIMVSEDFSIQAGGGNYTLDPGESQDILIRFEPHSPGTKTAMLNIFNSIGDFDNPIEILLEGTGTSEGAIGMEEGWNLISLPLQPLNAHPSAVLSGILGQCNSVWACDADTGWSMYAPGGNPGSLDEMKYAKGYWVEMGQPATLLPQGTVPDPTNILLKGGKWNLVGCNSPNPRSFGSAALPMPDGTCCYTYDTEKGLWLSYIMGGPDYFNTLEFFEAGKGYFIYVEQDWTIAP